LKIDGFMKVLVLSVSVGLGHMRAAEAIKKAAGYLHAGAEVDILDTFRYASPFLEKIILGTYMEILKMSPVIYGYIYKKAEFGQPLSGRGKDEFNKVLDRITSPRLEEYIKIKRPEAIICTHPFPLGVICRIKRRGAYRGPVLAAITDYTVHSFWIFKETDFYLVADEELVSQCWNFGISPERVYPTGIPIDPDFNGNYDKEKIRAELGLEPSLSTILIIGGGLGMGPLESAVKEISGSRSDCQLIVVTGTNAVLQEKLSRLVPGLACKAKVCGFVNDIHRLMAASDIMMGKSGGLTCAEAMAAGLPVLIVDPLPGQEERNAEFISAKGAGMRVTERALAASIESLLAEPEKIRKMAEKARSIGKPKAALDAVRIMAGAVGDKERPKTAGAEMRCVD